MTSRSRSRLRRWTARRLVTVVAGLVALAGIGLAVFLTSAKSPRPGAFYSAPPILPSAPPGTILRTEAITHPPAGASGWKVLYLSTSFTGKPVALSGLVFVPRTPTPAAERPVVAFTHGTTGVDSSCAPSNIGPSYWPAIDGLTQFLQAGDVVVAPDYQGLGTTGPHPYLVGRAEATATLDAVRAARLFSPAHAGTRFAAWGASQGGQAALFTGQETATYAPELKLAGVAAAAPAADLKGNFELIKDTAFGRVLSAYTLATWTQVYPQLHLNQLVSRAARPIVRRLAKICITEKKGVTAAAVTGLALKLTYLAKLPWETEPWKGLLAANSPGHVRTPAPIIITQGEADKLVLPTVNAAFAKGLCKQGPQVAYRAYQGVGHVDAGPKTAGDVAAWIADRFAGKQPTSTICGKR